MHKKLCLLIALAISCNTMQGMFPRLDELFKSMKLRKVNSEIEKTREKIKEAEKKATQSDLENLKTIDKKIEALKKQKVISVKHPTLPHVHVTPSTQEKIEHRKKILDLEKQKLEILSAES